MSRFMAAMMLLTIWVGVLIYGCWRCAWREVVIEWNVSNGHTCK